MVDVLVLLWSAATSLFRSRARLEAQILVLRQQINVLRRTSPKRFVFGTFDRLVFVELYRLVPGIVDALSIVRPETVVRWHRAGFRSFWRWKSRRRGGRPRVPLEIRKLIQDMSLANPFWGAPRIHGELLKLGIEVGQTSVAKYMAWRRGGPSQGWRTFLCNHADGIASIDLFVVPTLSFPLLYGFLRERWRSVASTELFLRNGRAAITRLPCSTWSRAWTDRKAPPVRAALPVLARAKLFGAN
jgi:hypothetical protein